MTPNLPRLLPDARWACWLGAVVLAAGLAGCSVLDKPVRATVYDFGPGPMTAPAAEQVVRPRLVLAEVEAPVALDGTALLYRLAYANPQQLLPYSQARWSMPPAQLVRQRLQDLLSRQRLVLTTTDAAAGSTPGPTPTLRVELDEFSHYFESPQTSLGLLRLRATVSVFGPQGDRVLGQRVLVVRQPAVTGDAAGGARALADAVAAAAVELETWISQQR